MAYDSYRLRQQHFKYQREIEKQGIWAMEPWAGSLEPIYHQCEEGHLFKATPTQLRASGWRRNKCPYCRNYGGQIDEHLAIERLAMYQPEYTLVGEWNGVGKSTEFQCQCGEVFTATYSRIRWDESKCPSCHPPGKAKMEKHASAYPARLEATGKGIVALEEYAGSATPILHRHEECGHEWRVVPNSLLNYPTGCPSCAEGGFNRKKPGMLYIITHWFKPEGDRQSRVVTNIGITNKDPWKRYSKKDQETFDMVYVFESDNGAAVFELEQKLISHFDYCRNEEGLNLEKKKGTREAFDVLPSDVIFMAQHYAGQLDTSRKAA